jgi:hypothetical protein
VQLTLLVPEPTFNDVISGKLADCKEFLANHLQADEYTAVLKINISVLMIRTGRRYRSDRQMHGKEL